MLCLSKQMSAEPSLDKLPAALQKSVILYSRAALDPQNALAATLWIELA